MAVSPMNAHFVWWDGSQLVETHINDILNNIDSIPAGVKNGFLILVLRYINPDTGQEYDNPKLGHFIAGRDHYYVNLRGNPVESVEYAVWDGNTTGNTRVNVYELTGENKEVKRTDVRANTFPNSRVFDGILVSDNDYATALAMTDRW